MPEHRIGIRRASFNIPRAGAICLSASATIVECWRANLLAAFKLVTMRWKPDEFTMLLVSTQPQLIVLASDDPFVLPESHTGQQRQPRRG